MLSYEEIMNYCSNYRIENGNIFDKNTNQQILDEETILKVKSSILLFKESKESYQSDMQQFGKVSKSQEDYIRKTMEKLYIGGRKTSMASMIGIVNQELKLEGNILDYTYYRLVYDFKLIERKHNNIYNAIFASQGAKNCTIEGLNEEIDMYDNPFSKDKLFPRKVGKNEFDKNLGKK